MAVLLGVNIDHVATVRQARGTPYPSVVEAAALAERAGADSITVHLREDRRHIQDADVMALCANARTRVNLEMAVTDDMLDIALQHVPADVCLVPEKREELTTEGGLDVAGNEAAVARAVAGLGQGGMRVGEYARVLVVVELLSRANKQGNYAPKYREKRSRFLSSMVHFMEIDFLRDGDNPSRDLFPELPRTPYFIFVARKTGMGRNEEGYPLRLQDPLPVIGLPLGPRRPDLPLDLAAAFRSAYDLSHRPSWRRSYQEGQVPGPPLDPQDQAWVRTILQP